MMASTRAWHRRSAVAFGVVTLGLTLHGAAAVGQSAPDVRQPIPRPQGTPQTHASVGFIAPDGWTVQPGPQGVTILNGPVQPQERPCEIRMLPLMQAQNDLAMQGASIVQAIAAANRVGPYAGQFGKDVTLSREDGISGTGWNYTDLSGQLGNTGITVRVLMVRIRNQVLPILGYTKTWSCLGNQSERDNDVWALLFHSLQVPGYTEASPDLSKELIGMWTSTSRGVGISLTFAPNGRFGSVAMDQQYAISASGQVWEVDKSWQGDGPYTVQGDELHTENPHGSEIERNVTRYFSIVRMPEATQPGTFHYVLRIVERSWNGSATWGFNPTSGNFVTHMVRQGNGS